MSERTRPATWDLRFMGLAVNVASWSKDPERRVGAVLVSSDRRRISFGYNGFPRGVADTGERLSCGRSRLKLMVHAEANALRNASFAADGCTLYCTSMPCHECAKEIIQAGVVRVVAPQVNDERRQNSKWAESWALAEALLTEAKVELVLEGVET